MPTQILPKIDSRNNLFKQMMAKPTQTLETLSSIRPSLLSKLQASVDNATQERIRNFSLISIDMGKELCTSGTGATPRELEQQTLATFQLQSGLQLHNA